MGEWEGVDIEREKMQAVPTQTANVLGLLGGGGHRKREDAGSVHADS